MTVYTIPVDPGVPDQRFGVELDGTTFSLRLRWNTTAAQWFLDVCTVDEEVINAGLAVVVGFPLGVRSVDPRRPPGRLMAYDTRRVPGALGLEDLGRDVILLYFDASEG